jgi:hypothetical protein
MVCLDIALIKFGLAKRGCSIRFPLTRFRRRLFLIDNRVGLEGCPRKPKMVSVDKRLQRQSILQPLRHYQPPIPYRQQHCRRLTPERQEQKNTDHGALSDFADHKHCPLI